MKQLITGLVFVIVLNFASLSAQEYSSQSIKVGAGVGIVEGMDEIGVGTFLSVGYQMSGWNQRLRYGPYVMGGGYIPFGITDTRDQFFRVTTFGFSGNIDILRYKAVSIYAGGGGILSYSRGLLGTGGWPEAGNTASDYFFNFYYGGSFSAGLRINPPRSRIAFELSPLNISFGNDYFMMASLKLGIDIKLLSE